MASHCNIACRTQDPAAVYAYLVCSEVDDCQLALVIQHLLKVGNMPEFVRGVAVKTLQKEKEFPAWLAKLSLPA